MQQSPKLCRPDGAIQRECSVAAPSSVQRRVLVEAGDKAIDVSPHVVICHGDEDFRLPGESRQMTIRRESISEIRLACFGANRGKLEPRDWVDSGRERLIAEAGWRAEKPFRLLNSHVRPFLSTIFKCFGA